MDLRPLSARSSSRHTIVPKTCVFASVLGLSNSIVLWVSVDHRIAGQELNVKLHSFLLCMCTIDLFQMDRGWQNHIHNGRGVHRVVPLLHQNANCSVNCRTKAAK